MKTILLAIIAALGCFSCTAQHPQDWGKLLEAKKYEQAEALCIGWTHSTSTDKRVEAEKCLANVELCKGQSLSLMGNDAGGGTLGEVYKPEAVDKALAHLNSGIELAPQDLSIHQGRLHVLEVAGRFDDMAKALDESVSIYKGPDALQSWMAYDFELGDAGQAKAGLQIAEVLNRHYPNNHEIIGNMGAFHDMLKQWDQGLPYLKQAVALAPDDPLDSWNLGWAYAHLNQDEDADKWMSRAIQLDPAEKQAPGCKCLYAEFVETHLKDQPRACELQKASCEEDRQTACAKPRNSTK
ncbi:MAG TPA: tetratricopeptide repeat protein [Acidobacteriaceae bacterium]